MYLPGTIARLYQLGEPSMDILFLLVSMSLVWLIPTIWRYRTILQYFTRYPNELGTGLSRPFCRRLTSTNTSDAFGVALGFILLTDLKESCLGEAEPLAG